MDFPKAAYLDQGMPPLPPLNPPAYGTVNRRYEPWGGNPTAASTSATKYDWRVKDPVAKLSGNSDAWDFPTNKFPNPGWVGRVHRGTPWQTVYLKAAGNAVTPALTIYPLPASGYRLDQLVGQQSRRDQLWPARGEYAAVDFSRRTYRACDQLLSSGRMTALQPSDQRLAVARPVQHGVRSQCDTGPVVH